MGYFEYLESLTMRGMFAYMEYSERACVLFFISLSSFSQKTSVIISILAFMFPVNALSVVSSRPRHARPSAVIHASIGRGTHVYRPMRYDMQGFLG